MNPNDFYACVNETGAWKDKILVHYRLQKRCGDGVWIYAESKEMI